MYKITKRTVLSPVSLISVETHLRVNEGDEKAYLESLIRAATDYVEQYCNIKLMTTHIATELQVKANQPITLRFGDLKSVESVFIDDVLLDKSEYKVSYINNSIMFYQNATVVINYIVGTDNALDIPPSIAQAILLIIGSFYEHREQQTELNLKEIPFGVANLLAKYVRF